MPRPKKGARHSEMVLMYRDCWDVRKVAKHFKVKVSTVKRVLRAATP